MNTNLIAPKPEISESALLALYVMEMVDAGARISIYANGVDDDLRERILGRLVEKGWVREDNPSNGDMRGARHPHSRAKSVVLWA